VTPEQRAAIRARLDAATPWPWRIAYYAGQHDEEGAVIVGQGDVFVTHTATCNGRPWAQYHGDAELIAHAPTDIDHLLAYVERLEGLLRDLAIDSVAAAEVLRLRRVIARAGNGQAELARETPF